MSILIKGREMPENCDVCVFKNDCEFSMPLKERPFDCPLIEVPPHGRLIDADALIPKFVHGHFDDMYVPELEINLAPTIIPSDKDGEA